MWTERLIERYAFVGVIPPTNHTNNTDTTIAGIDMSKIRRLLTIVNVGTLGSGANVQVYYQASANSNMAGPINVASSIPITGNTNNRLELLEVRADQLPAGTRYVQPVIIVNTAASFVDAIVIGDEGAYKPNNQNTLANTVDQSVAT